MSGLDKSIIPSVIPPEVLPPGIQNSSITPASLPEGILMSIRSSLFTHAIIASSPVKSPAFKPSLVSICAKFPPV